MKLYIHPARIGVQWVKLGLQTFFKQPLALGALFMLFMAMLTLITQIPFVGPILSLVIFPALSMGMIAAAREAAQGNLPLPPILFISFRQGSQNIRQMLSLGLLYTLAMFVITAVVTPIDAGRFMLLAVGHTQITSPEQFQAQINDGRFVLAMWIWVILNTVVSMLFWQASALTHWHGIACLKSLFFCTVGLFKNIRPYIIYALMWMLLLLVSYMLLAIVFIITRWQAVLIASIPIMLILGAMFITSVWFIFQDCFCAPAATPAAPAQEA